MVWYLGDKTVILSDETVTICGQPHETHLSLDTVRRLIVIFREIVRVNDIERLERVPCMRNNLMATKE